MKRYKISTGSVTYAIKGRDILRKHGYNASIERDTSGIAKNGCGYLITVTGDIRIIEDLLRKSGVKIIKIQAM